MLNDLLLLYRADLTFANRNFNSIHLNIIAPHVYMSSIDLMNMNMDMESEHVHMWSNDV